MRAVVFSDAHADWSTLGRPRFDDIALAFEEVFTAATGAGPTGGPWATDVFFLGDLCDPDCGPVAFRIARLACDFALRLAAQGIRSHWLAGNHDALEDGSGGTTLEPLRALRLGGAIVGLEGDSYGPVQVYDRPSIYTRGGELSVLALPFTSSCAPYDPAHEVERLFGLLDASGDHDVPLVIIGHLELPGITPGSETTDMPRGRNIRFPFEAIAERCSAGPKLLLNGHYHQRQRYTANLKDGRQLVVHVPGALERLTFGEEGNQPGFMFVEV